MPEVNDSDDFERGYLAGQEQFYINMLRQAVSGLGMIHSEANAARWIIERAEAIQKLREVCAKFGDLEWSDDLYLPDIIDKHLYRHLGEE